MSEERPTSSDSKADADKLPRPRLSLRQLRSARSNEPAEPRPDEPKDNQTPPEVRAMGNFLDDGDATPAPAKKKPELKIRKKTTPPDASPTEADPPPVSPADAEEPPVSETSSVDRTPPSTPKPATAEPFEETAKEEKPDPAEAEAEGAAVIDELYAAGDGTEASLPLIGIEPEDSEALTASDEPVKRVPPPKRLRLRAQLEAAAEEDRTEAPPESTSAPFPPSDPAPVPKPISLVEPPLDTPAEPAPPALDQPESSGRDDAESGLASSGPAQANAPPALPGEKGAMLPLRSREETFPEGEGAAPPSSDGESGPSRKRKKPRGRPIPPGGVPAKPKMVISTMPASKAGLEGGPPAQPPPVSLDSIKPTPSFKPPPPSSAPVRTDLKAPKPEKGAGRSMRPLKWVIALLVLGALGGAGYYFGRPLLSEMANEDPSAEMDEALAATEGRPTARPAISSPRAPSPARTQETRSLPVVVSQTQALVDALYINMVRDRGERSMIVVDGVVYRIGAILDPSTELRFVGFSKNGRRLLFEDANGRRYERGF